MKARKLIVFTLLAILLVSTLACGGGEEEAAPTPTLEPGACLVYEVDYRSTGNNTPAQALAEMEEIIKERIYAHGFMQQVVIETVEENRISIFLPDVYIIEEARKIVGNIGQFNLRESVDDEWVIADAMGPDEEIKLLTGAYLAECQASAWTRTELTCDAELEIKFAAPGAALLSQFTERNAGETVGIFIGDAPLVQVRITEPAGNLLEIDPVGCGLAEYLAETINHAALPLSLRYIGGYVQPRQTEPVGEEPTPGAMPDFEYLSYTDENEGFSMWCPRDWYQKEEPGSVLFCLSPGACRRGVIYWFQDFRVYKFDSLGSLSASFISWKLYLEEELEGYAEVSEEQMTLGGVRAVKHIFDFSQYSPQATFPVRVVELLLVKDGFFYIVMCEVPSECWDDYQSTFDAIISSFRLLE